MLATAMLAGCGLVAPPPHHDIDEEARQRYRRPYRPADPQAFATVINAYRAQNGLAAWRPDDRLTQIAGAYAQHLADAHEMTHSLAPYGGLEKRLQDAGFAYSVAGENLGQGQTDIDDLFDGWRNSPAHDRGMRDPDATIFGIASAYRPDDQYQSYWCMIYAKPRGNRGPHIPGPFDLGVWLRG
jgi:uncharacterized protein YkwD